MGEAAATAADLKRGRDGLLDSRTDEFARAAGSSTADRYAPTPGSGSRKRDRDYDRSSSRRRSHSPARSRKSAPSSRHTSPTASRTSSFTRPSASYDDDRYATPVASTSKSSTAIGAPNSGSGGSFSIPMRRPPPRRSPSPPSASSSYRPPPPPPASARKPDQGWGSRASNGSRPSPVWERDRDRDRDRDRWGGLDSRRTDRDRDRDRDRSREWSAGPSRIMSGPSASDSLSDRDGPSRRHPPPSSSRAWEPPAPRGNGWAGSPVRSRSDRDRDEREASGSGGGGGGSGSFQIPYLSRPRGMKRPRGGIADEAEEADRNARSGRAAGEDRWAVDPLGERDRSRSASVADGNRSRRGSPDGGDRRRDSDDRWSESGRNTFARGEPRRHADDPASFTSTRYARPSASAETSRPPTLLERISRTPTPSASRRRSASPPSTSTTIPARSRAIDRDHPYPLYPPFRSANNSPPARPLLIDTSAALPYSTEPDGSETPPLPSASAPAQLVKAPPAATVASAPAPPPDSDDEMEEGELQEEGEIEEPAKPSLHVEEGKPFVARAASDRSASPPRAVSPPSAVGGAASPRLETTSRPVAEVSDVLCSRSPPRDDADVRMEADREPPATIQTAKKKPNTDVAAPSPAPSSSPVLGRAVDSIASAPSSTETSARLSSSSPLPEPAADTGKALADSSHRRASPAEQREPVAQSPKASGNSLPASGEAAEAVAAPSEEPPAAVSQSDEARSGLATDQDAARSSEAGPRIEHEEGRATSPSLSAVETVTDTASEKLPPAPIKGTVSAAAVPPLEKLANAEASQGRLDLAMSLVAASAPELETRDGEARHSSIAEGREIKEEDTPMVDARQSGGADAPREDTRLNMPVTAEEDAASQPGRLNSVASPKAAHEKVAEAPNASPRRDSSSPPVELTIEQRRVKLIGDRDIEPFGERHDLLNTAWSTFEDRHARLSASLADTFVERDERRKKHIIALRRQYKNLQCDWKAHCRRLDDLKERQHRRANGGNPQNATAPQTPSIDSAGMPFYPEPVTPGPSLTGGRSNRRGTGASVGVLGFSDTVRSEAEFLEILASLETADLRDPDVRAARTAAVVPDMVVDESERREVLDLAFDDERYRVADPVSEFAIDAPLDVWTEHEVEIFCKRYALHPKQFGKISQGLPDKSTAQCVLFYYRMKNTIDFRSLSDRRGRDGRRKKSKKRPEGGKGSSLLSNLNKKARPALAPPREDEPDEDDEEEPSAPASPRAERHRAHDADKMDVDEGPRRSDASGADEQPVATNGAPAPRRIRLVSKTPLSRPVDLPSEGMMEAAEVLGALAALPGAQPTEQSVDDDRALETRNGTASGRSGAGRARRARMDLDTLPTEEALAASPFAVAPEVDPSTPSAEVTKARRRNNTSSYWTLAERAEYQRLLTEYGPDWRKIAAGLGNKTWVQCRNWYQNQAKKNNLVDIVNSADLDAGRAQVFHDAQDYSPQAVYEPHSATPPSTVVHTLPALPTTDLASKSGRHLRDLLNDDDGGRAADPEPSARQDWFGTDVAAETGAPALRRSLSGPYEPRFEIPRPSSAPQMADPSSRITAGVVPYRPSPMMSSLSAYSTTAGGDAVTRLPSMRAEPWSRPSSTAFPAYAVSPLGSASPSPLGAPADPYRRYTATAGTGEYFGVKPYERYPPSAEVSGSPAPRSGHAVSIPSFPSLSGQRRVGDSSFSPLPAAPNGLVRPPSHWTPPT